MNTTDQAPASESDFVRVRARPLVGMSETLAAEIEQSHTITPNRRIARAIEESYGDWQITRGINAWARPQVSTLKAFILRAGEARLARYSPEFRILSPAMQRALFLSVAPTQLSDPENWYNEIAQAWRLVHHFPIEQDQGAHLETSNTLLFRQWAEAAEMLLNQDRLVTEDEVAKQLLDGLKQHEWQPELPLVAWGFSDAHPPTPVEGDLMDTLMRMGLLTRAAATQPPNPPKTPRLVEFEQPEDELRSIALWARERLERAEAPIAIGIAFPDANQRRPQLERALTNLLYPEDPPAPDDARLFDLAGGTPLSAFAVCDHALVFLRWAITGASSEELGRLRDSPFLEMSNSALPLAKRRKRKRSISAWFDAFQKALQGVSWPGGAHLDSLTFQHASALGELASELAQASQFSPDCRAEAALDMLERAAHERRHEVQRTGAPIRVLDIKDASAFRFTHLWVAGMRGADWPSPGSANAFVPRQSQRDASVPGVTPESRLRLARRITAKLSDCAPDLVFSFATLEGDEHHGPSALLTDTILTAPEFFGGRAYRTRIDYSHPYMGDMSEMEDKGAQPARLVVIRDDRGPPCEDGEREATAAVVRDQSNCPFRAFALHRLGVTEHVPQSTLPDARALGSAVHLALDLAYRDLPDQAALHTHPDLARLAEASAKRAIESVMPTLPRSLRNGQTRLIASIAKAWFDEDAKRPAYAKLKTEFEVAAELEGMTLRLKIDRLDQDMATGRWVITDYKTSPPPLTQLSAHATLHEPQLPLYANALREAHGLEPLALSFGDISGPEKAGYRHCSGDARLVPRAAMRATHMQVLKESGAVVRGLVRDHAAGKAQVKPRALACERCHLGAFCRIGTMDSK